MGGIVVKKALNITQHEEDEYKNTRQSTAAIFFLATPHRGSEAANFASVLADVANFVSFGSIFGPLLRADLIKSLRSGAEGLQQISRDFRKQTKDIKIYSFIEKATIKGMKSKASLRLD